MMLKVEAPSRPKGFTLVELLVVIAIIGLLIGLLLPAIQSARESSRRSSCTAKLHDIANACHNYLSVKGAFPPGVKHAHYSTQTPTELCCVDGNAPAGVDPWASDTRSFVSMLLPFVEESARYQQLDFTKGGRAAPNVTVNRTALSFLSCPSNPSTGLSRPDGMAAQHYGPSGGTNGSYCQRPSNPPNGMFWGSHVSRRDCRPSEVADGLSNTIMVCERLSYTPVSLDVANGGFRSAVAFYSSGNLWGWDVRGNIMTMLANLSTQPNVYNSTEAWSTPYSFHPGGLHVAYGDGAVQFINETIASNVWQDLARKADGFATKYNP